MPFQPKRYTAGKDAVSAADLNARAEEIKRLGRISIDGGSVISDGSGIAFSIPRGGANYVLGSITGTGSGANDNAHSWKQHFWLTDGDSMELPNGIVGDATTTPMVNPAYAINGSIVDAGTRIMAWKGLAHVESGLVVVQDWFFVVGGGSSNPSFIAKITSGTNPYAWTEQDCAADGKFTDKASGARTGTIGSGGHNPAWEYNKNTAVAAGTYVRLWPCFSGSGGVSGSQTSGGDTEYVFHHAGGSGVALIRLSTSTKDANGYQDGFIRTYDTGTNTFADGTAVLFRNHDSAVAALPLGVYYGIKVGHESSPDKDVYAGAYTVCT